MGNANNIGGSGRNEPPGNFLGRLAARLTTPTAEQRGSVLPAVAAVQAGREVPAPLPVFGGEPPTAENGPLRRELARYEFVRWVLRLFAMSLCLAGLAVAVLFVAGVMVRNRPAYTLVAPPSLEAEEEALFSGQPEANFDDLILYLNATLPLMHKVDDRGSPDLLLLRSLVAPSVYEEVRGELLRSARTAKQNFIVQNLVITRIEDVAVKKDRGRVGAYVKGYLAIIVQSRNKHVIMPYRAEVVMDLTPPSRLNRFPFVMVRREVRTDKAATAWDAARAGSPTPTSLVK